MSGDSDRNERTGYALTDMLVGLTLLGLGLGLALHAGAQALRAANSAAAFDQSRRLLEWRLTSEWRNALGEGGIRRGAGWVVTATPIAAAEQGSDPVICRVEAVARGRRGARSIKTHRFCQPGPQ